MTEETNTSWPRDWELALRSAEILWSLVGDRPSIYERRTVAFSDRVTPPLACSVRESRRFDDAVAPVCEWIESLWIHLYESSRSCKGAFTFPDGFSVLFFLRVLYANENVLFRGHQQAEWTLTTSLERAERKSASFANEAKDAGHAFFQELAKGDLLKTAYPGSIPDDHREAILQHYGFPTDLLDFTYSSDVALFFAEGGSDYLSDDWHEGLGAIYAIPTYALPRNARLVTLPPAIMRTSLQRGVFVGRLRPDQQSHIERQHRYVYRHKGMPVWNGLHNVQFGTHPGLSRYLYPVSDPIEQVASRFREAISNNKETNR